MKDIFVSSSPHIHSPEDTPWIMRQVIYALIPGALIGVYFFGIPAIRVIAISVVSCIIIEALWQKLMRQDITVTDGSAALTAGTSPIGRQVRMGRYNIMDTPAPIKQELLMFHSF